jgi:serine/threonine protein kinase
MATASGRKADALHRVAVERRRWDNMGDMLQEAQLQGLFARYVEHHVEHGDTLSVAELCRNDPELRGRLQALIDDYHALDETLASPSALRVGDRVGSYRIVAQLGSGGMGEVYKAEDMKLRRPAAIKVLHPEAAADRDRLQRFEREARAASALNHPNIVTIYDIDHHRGAPYIAMECVEGRTLGELMPEDQLPLPRALDYAIQIADGLSRAHAQGIVHRDLKPENIMVTPDGLIKILDFGLAKLTEPAAGGVRHPAEEHPETQEGHILGTAPYMSPEQAEGRPVDARSDIFSFGSVLYEMVTGRRPFSGDSSLKLLAAIVENEPESAGALQPAIPLELDRIIHRALQKKPERRFQSTADLKVELLEVREELESGRVVSAEQALIEPQAVLLRPRHWPWLVAALGIMAVGVGIWIYRDSSSAPNPETRTVQLTSLTGCEQWPALSPGGRQVAFTWDGGNPGGPFELYVRLVDVGEPLQLTDGGGSARAPAWSPEGSRIAFLRGKSGQ